jgi:nucleotide-binding universal stress UspA family protein
VQWPCFGCFSFWVFIKLKDRILLILNALDSDEDRLAIEPLGLKRDVRVKGPSRDGDETLVEAAFKHAIESGKKVTAIQVLSSNLYHWGRHDIIISGPGKMTFLLYVRDLVMKRSQEKAAALKKKAQDLGIPLEIMMSESKNPVDSIVQEARKGYGVVFVPKERKKLFPLMKRHTLESMLKKHDILNVIAC